MPELKQRKKRSDTGTKKPGIGGRKRTHETGEKLERFVTYMPPGFIAWVKERGGSPFLVSLVHGAMQDESNRLGGFDHPMFDDDGSVTGCTQEEWDRIEG